MKLRQLILLCFVLLSILASMLYVTGRTALLLNAALPWYDKILALLLLGAEIFMVVHAFGYFLNIIHVLKRGTPWWLDPKTAPTLRANPVVAVIVPSYHEPIEIVSNTLTCLRNLSYPNKQIFLLDDTRYDLPNSDQSELASYRSAIEELCEESGVNLFRHRWGGAKAGIINDFLAWNRGSPRNDSSVVEHQEPKVNGRAQYVAIFDAEQNPLPDFLEPLLAIAEADPTIAFIQTPQYYTNFQENRVARAAGLMQIFFYEYICEGKGSQSTMFCCGTNVMFREEALWRVGGLDESSVTEDFATSIKLHLSGWNSLYHPRVCAFGMGPVDLKGFFVQQFRWSRGTIGLLPTIVKAFIRNPFQMSFVKWWEYFLSGTHYLIGMVFLITAVCPILFIFSDQPTYFTSVEFYVLFYWPYTILAAATFLLTLHDRKYRLSEIITGLLLIPVTFPIYIRGAFAAFFGAKSKFRVTNKGRASSLPLRALWPQLLLCSASFAGAVWGVNRIIYEQDPFWALLGNIFWCLYFFAITSVVLYFNNPERPRETHR